MIGLPQRPRRDLGDEQRDADADRHRDHQGDDADEERAVDHRPGAELALRRVPVVGEDAEALLAEPRPRVLGGGVERSAPRITSTSSPLASAIHRNTRSVNDPGGRGRRAETARRRGAGGSFGRGGAVTAMCEIRNLRELRGGRAGARDGWAAPVPCTTRPRSRRGDGDLLDLRLGLLQQTLGQRRVVDRRGQLSGRRRRCSSGSP